MKAGERQDRGEEQSRGTGAIGSANTHSRPEHELHAEVGSAERLQVTFARAASAADRAVGLWLARSLEGSASYETQRASSGTPNELRALRAIVRAAATTYARRLRDEGATPERMLVLVKTVTSQRGSPGCGTQELTNDVVRWSIEAYFDD